MPQAQQPQYVQGKVAVEPGKRRLKTTAFLRSEEPIPFYYKQPEKRYKPKPLTGEDLFEEAFDNVNIYEVKETGEPRRAKVTSRQQAMNIIHGGDILSVGANAGGALLAGGIARLFAEGKKGVDIEDLMKQVEMDTKLDKMKNDIEGLYKGLGGPLLVEEYKQGRESDIEDYEVEELVEDIFENPEEYFDRESVLVQKLRELDKSDRNYWEHTTY